MSPPDVLIAGAGPAGSVAAVLLARMGARVRLIDRARFPRDKLCGDTLNPGALARLRHLGLSDRVEAVGLRVDGMIVSGEGGVQVRGRYAGRASGRAITRRDLDAFLLAAAVDAGVVFDEATVVRRPLIEESGGLPTVRGLRLAHAGGRVEDVRARVTIAADGRRSAIALALGLLCHPASPRRWATGAYFEGVTGLSSYGEMHIRPHGYLGVAPVPGGLANACYVSTATRGHADPAQHLLSAFHGEPLLAARFASSRMVSAPMVLGPLAVDVRAAGVPGLLLAGDAAGFVDPMTGDGLRFAIRGAELAAAVAGQVLTDGVQDGHRRLAAMRAAEFAGKQRFNRTLRTLVGSPRGVSVASHAARWAPGLIRQLIRIAGDAA